MHFCLVVVALIPIIHVYIVEQLEIRSNGKMNTAFNPTT